MALRASVRAATPTSLMELLCRLQADKGTLGLAVQPGTTGPGSAELGDPGDKHLDSAPLLVPASFPIPPPSSPWRVRQEGVVGEAPTFSLCLGTEGSEQAQSGACWLCSPEKVLSRVSPEGGAQIPTPKGQLCLQRLPPALREFGACGSEVSRASPTSAVWGNAAGAGRGGRERRQSEHTRLMSGPGSLSSAGWRTPGKPSPTVRQTHSRLSRPWFTFSASARALAPPSPTLLLENLPETW